MSVSSSGEGRRSRRLGGTTAADSLHRRRSGHTRASSGDNAQAPETGRAESTPPLCEHDRSNADGEDGGDERELRPNGQTPGESGDASTRGLPCPLTSSPTAASSNAMPMMSVPACPGWEMTSTGIVATTATAASAPAPAPQGRPMHHAASSASASHARLTNGKTKSR